MDIKIRKALEKDYNEIYAIITETFKNSEFSNGDEADLVKALKQSDSFIPNLSLVAELNKKIVGHILFSKIKIGDSEQIALAPISVLPEFQRKGIGTKLITEAHKIAKKMGYKVSVVLGHQDYYPKFGYEVASKLGIKPPFEVPDINFMAANLTGEKIHINGVVEYAKEFFE